MRHLTITPENAEAFRPYIAAPEFPKALDPACYGIGLAEGALCCGALLLAPGEGEEWELCSLCIDPAVRGRGEGSRLLEAGKAAARGAGARSLTASFAFRDNRPMAAFLERHGFSPATRRALHHTLPLHALEGARFFRRGTPPAAGAVPLGEAPEGALARFLEDWGDQIPPTLSLERLGPLADPRISTCWVEEGRVLGYVLFCLRGEELFLAAAYFLPEARGRLLPVLRACAVRGVPLLPPETPVHICAINGLSEGLIERMTEGRCTEVLEEWHASCAL